MQFEVKITKVSKDEPVLSECKRDVKTDDQSWSLHGEQQNGQTLYKKKKGTKYRLST